MYDLDGTLVDTLEDIAGGVLHALRALGAPPVTIPEIRLAVGRGVHDLIAQCLKTADAQRVQEGVAAFRAHYAEHCLDRSRPYPGTQELLAHFRGRHQAVITNKPDPFAHRILDALGLAGHFVQIIAGGSAYPHKPDPAALQAVMRAVGAAPPETLVVGDSVIDVQMGRRAGAATAVVLHGLGTEAELRTAAPDVLVADFAELLMLARQRKW